MIKPELTAAAEQILKRNYQSDEPTKTLVAGVITHVESWRSERSDPGVQIDLMINRNDHVISLCEMKFSDTVFSFTKKQAQELRAN